MELTWLFAAQAQAEKTVGGRESNGADGSASSLALGIDIVQLHNESVAVRHRGSQDFRGAPLGIGSIANSAVGSSERFTGRSERGGGLFADVECGG